MREILFRGKTINSGEWVYGNLIQDKYIVGDIIDWEEDYFNTEWWAAVIPETVGQYTGIEDANGKKIFEGDILEIYMQHYKQTKPYVIDDIHEFYSDYYQTDMYYAITNLKVIGNIHDNPELVNEELK